jgi:hypothetical protein
MRSIKLALAAVLGLTAMSALAQVPPVIDSANGARPGHDPGVGESLPKSDKASNIRSADVRSVLAPTLPAPAVGKNATTTDYLRAARAALVAGRTGLAQQSLEMAETRALDRAIAPGEASGASDSTIVSQIRDARRALGSGDNAGCIAAIDLALAG